RRGFDVGTTRDQSAREEYDTLLILTPGIFTDPATLDNVLQQRRYVGPTIVILPKWMSGPLPDNAPDEARDDWVQLAPGWSPAWFEEIALFEPLTLGQGSTNGWRGMGLAGNLPDNR